MIVSSITDSISTKNTVHDFRAATSAFRTGNPSSDVFSCGPIIRVVNINWPLIGGACVLNLDKIVQ